MKILFISHDSTLYGAPKALLELIIEMTKKNVYCMVITPSYGDLNKALDERNISNKVIYYHWGVSKYTENKFIRLAKRLRYIFGNYLSYILLPKDIKYQKFDFIYTNTSVIDFGAFIATRKKILHVLHIREAYDSHFGFSAFSKSYFRNLVKHSNAIIVISKSLREHLSKSLPHEKTYLIYDGIDTQKNSRSVMKIHKDNIKCVFVGKLNPEKGQHMILLALAELDQIVKDNIYLDFFGDGNEDYVSYLKDIISKHQLNNVRFNGYVDNVSSILREYDIGFNSSKFEAFGRTTVEYMLSSVLPIVSDTGANPEIVTHNKNGLVFSYNNIKDIKSKIEYAFNNFGELKKMAYRSSAEAKRRFSLENHVENVYILLEKLLLK